MHTDDVIDTDFSLIDNDSIDIYSRSEMPNEDYTDTVYGSKEEYNTLVYDIDQNSNENSGEISYIVQEDSDSDSKSNLQTLTSISKSDIHVSANSFLPVWFVVCWFSYFARSVRLFWGMVVRGCARRDLC